MIERPFDPAQFAERSRQGWDTAAMGWKKWAPTIETFAQVVNDRLVGMAGLDSGHKVLDIATGYGEPLMTALERIGSSGHSVERQQEIWGAVADAVRPYEGADKRVHLDFECHCIVGYRSAA